MNTIQRENRGGGRKKVFDPRTFSEFRSPISTSQLFTDNSYHSKKHYNNNDIYQGIGSAGRLKPLHLEISYQSLCAVYLFPPQRIYLPIMVDLDCIAKAF